MVRDRHGSSSSPELSVIVPAYNEASHIEQNLSRLLAYLDQGTAMHEVIVVDDGSADETAVRAERLDHPSLRVLRLNRNRGKGRALERGVLAAGGSIVVLLDADLEIPPEEIGPLVTRLQETGADLALGTKYGAPGEQAWPLHRRLLSRLYQAVTAVLFRLPLRDTQTGLKAIRTSVARRLVPHLHCTQFAWDLEFVLLAVETGHRVVTVPVSLEPTTRASRVGWLGALRAGVDTLTIFLRHRWFAGYAAAERRPPQRTTRILVSGDDLGLSADVDAGLIAGLDQGGLRSVSALTVGASWPAARAALRSRRPLIDLGLHLELLQGQGLLAYALRSLRAPARTARRTLDGQLKGAGEMRDDISHLDVHRHAWCLPWVRRATLRAARGAGIPAVRSLRPIGPLFNRGVREGAKRLLLTVLSIASRGQARRHALAVPDGYVDVREARRWIQAGKLPSWVRGRTVEVISHPALGAAAVPRNEASGLDRVQDARDVLDPPLARALGGLGAEVIGFAELAANQRHRANGSSATGEWTGRSGRRRRSCRDER